MTHKHKVETKKRYCRSHVYRFGIQMDKSINFKLTGLAHAQNRSKAEIVREALNDYFEKLLKKLIEENKNETR